jgi:uncharacterized membrane protein YfcA
MPVPEYVHAGATFAAAFVAGAINSVAGGGTLVTFPTLIWLGLSSVTANATSTVAIWPGSLGAIWGYRRELRTSDTRLLALIIPSIAGGVLGALLLRWTPPAIFDKLVPFLILFATLMFVAQEPIQRRLKSADAAAHHTAQWLTGAIAFQFLVALYGGYFGAGIGILMLAALSIIGMTDIHQMNGWKNLFALCINGVAALYFIWARMVYWPDVLIMAVGSIVGGYACAGVARRMGRATVRRIVILIGFAMSLSLFLKVNSH